MEADLNPQSKDSLAAADAAGIVHGKSKSRRSRRVLLWVVVLLLLGWLLPTLIRLNYLRDEIASALSANLGRVVRVGDVHPHVLSGWASGMGLGLGVEVENVEIGDDPRFGVEPLARIETLEARLALRSVWHRRLEFSHVVLRNPSVNLVRDAHGQLNLVTLIGDRSGASESHPVDSEKAIQYPDVRIVDGRLNFKIGNRKKLIYLAGLDVDLRAPRRADQAWQFEFSGTPTRASFEQVPAFVVRGGGQIGPFPAGGLQDMGAPLKLNWQVRDALLGEVSAVLAGSNQGTHGLVTLTGEATGTTSLLRISGKAGISDLHRWDVIPDTVATDVPAEFSGVLDWQDDAFQLNRFSLPLRVNGEEAGAIELKGRIERLSVEPSLQLEADARDIHLAALSVLAEPFAVQIDPSLGISGTMQGHLNLHGPAENWSGELELKQVELMWQSREEASPVKPAGSSVQLAAATMRIAGGKLEMASTTARTGNESSAQVKVSGDLKANSYRIALRSTRSPLRDVLAWMPEAQGGQVENASGSAALNVEVSLGPGRLPEYKGRVTITDARMAVEGIVEPLEIASSRIQLNGRTLLLRPLGATIAGAKVRGEATVQLANSVEHEPTKVIVNLQAEEMDLEQFAVMPPAQEKSSWLNELMPERQPETKTLASSVTIGGRIRADRVQVRGFEFTEASAKGEWSDQGLRLEEVSGVLAGGRATGTLEVRQLRGSDSTSSRMALSANFRRVDLQRLSAMFSSLAGHYEGFASGKMNLSSQGRTWEDAWSNLAGSGEISGENVVLNNWEVPVGDGLRSKQVSRSRVGRFSEATARFEIADQEVSIVQFEGFRDRESGGTGRNILRASGRVGFDKSVEIVAVEEGDRSARPTEWRWTGTVTAPKLEEVPAFAKNTLTSSP